MSRRRKAMLAPTDQGSGTATLLSSSEAVQRLGVSKATLYSYVSRGLLTAVPDPNDTRVRRYSSFEVELLLRRKDGGRQREQQALAALNEGWPVLDTALSSIHRGQPIYRGQSALTLAQHQGLEEVARLLWQFDVGIDPFTAPAPQLSTTWQQQAAALQAAPGVALTERTLALFALALTELDSPPDWADDAALAQACGQHLRMAFACFLAQAPQAQPFEQQLRQAWRLTPRADEALRRALVLNADHDMNMVGFSARCLASVGASLGASMLAGLCNLSATFNGGAIWQVEAFCDELLQAHDLPSALTNRLQQGQGLPGFNHLSYPAGDPRAQALLGLAAAQATSPLDGVAPLVERLTGWKPALDFGLVVLRRALKAPRDAALTLLMAARCVGILAHVLEQRRSGQRIVPRARYLGPLG